MMTAKEFFKTEVPPYVRVFVYIGGAACVAMGIITFLSTGIIGLIDAALFGGLGYGILAKRSRVCSVISCAYFAIQPLAVSWFYSYLGYPLEQSAFWLTYTLTGATLLSILGTFKFQTLWAEYQKKMSPPHPDQNKS